MSWHTPDGRSSCKLSKPSDVYSRLNAAFSERKRAYGDEVRSPYPDKLSYSREHNVNLLSWTTALRYFMYPPYAEDILEKAKDYTYIQINAESPSKTEFRTLEDDIEKYKDYCGYRGYFVIEPHTGNYVPYVGSTLLPIPSAEVLDSHYRFINNMVYMIDPIWDTVAPCTLLWRVSYRYVSRRICNTGDVGENIPPEAYMYDMTNDRRNGVPCYIFIGQSFNYSNDSKYVWKLEAVMQPPSYRPDDPDYDDAKTQDEFAKDVEETAINLMKGRPFLEDYVYADGHNTPPWYDWLLTPNDINARNSCRAYLVDIVQEGRSHEDDHIVSLSEIYNGYVTLTQGDLEYAVTYKDNPPELTSEKGDVYITHHKDPFNNYQIHRKPIKLDLEYYDPPSNSEQNT